MQRDSRHSDSIEINLSPKGKAWAIAFAAFLICLALLDFVVLQGERLVSKNVDLQSAAPVVVELTRIGEPHLFQIKTKRRFRGEVSGIAVDYRLVDPNGVVIDQSSEIVSRKDRYIAFTPAVAGAYTLEVESTGLMSGPRRGSGHLYVFVNDHRLGRHIGL